MVITEDPEVISEDSEQTDPVVISVDPQQTEQVVINQTDNAGSEIVEANSSTLAATTSSVAIQAGPSILDKVEMFCDKHDDGLDDESESECYDFQDEDFNFDQILFFSRD